MYMCRKKLVMLSHNTLSLDFTLSVLCRLRGGSINFMKIYWLIVVSYINNIASYIAMHVCSDSSINNTIVIIL